MRRKYVTLHLSSSPSEKQSWKQAGCSAQAHKTRNCFISEGSLTQLHVPNPAPSQPLAALSFTARNKSTHPLFLNTIIYYIIPGSRKGCALITTTCAAVQSQFPITGFSRRLHFSRKTFAFLTQEVLFTPQWDLQTTLPSSAHHAKTQLHTAMEQQREEEESRTVLCCLWNQNVTVVHAQVPLREHTGRNFCGGRFQARVEIRYTILLWLVATILLPICNNN